MTFETDKSSKSELVSQMKREIGSITEHYEQKLYEMRMMYEWQIDTLQKNHSLITEKLRMQAKAILAKVEYETIRRRTDITFETLVHDEVLRVFAIHNHPNLNSLVVNKSVVPN